ncbi:hypothetical protein CVT24_001568 [Panaeolus cyanescens]|uniref:F-box domain-containing protein n=1 Tax=Panaeolus cyanescens TaxID=181874 RepID=A0A409YFH5_9AGAR|nr:hypothetical protein CVT24_001568 [Panaeolus cyanescens]
MTSDLPQDTQKIAEVCKKKLTDRILCNLQPFINAHMSITKERRLYTERKAIWVTRLQQLRMIYENVLASYPLYKPRPRVADIFEVPRIKSLVLDTPPDVILEVNDFAITPETLADVIQEAYKVIDAKLLTVVAAVLERGTYDPATVLNLATTVFSVKIPQTDPVQRRPMHTFRAIATSSTGLYFHGDQPTEIDWLVRMTFGHTTFNTRALHFDVAAHNIFLSIVTETCGLDPTTTTYQDMEDKHPFIECITCNRVQHGRLVMRWWEAAYHSLCETYILACPNSNFLTIQGDDIEDTKRIIQCADEKMNDTPYEPGEKLDSESEESQDMIVAGHMQQGQGGLFVKIFRKRGTRGLLEGLPFEILFEIFDHFLPADLLSVGRVSREFKDLVMSRQFVPIWKHTRSRFPGMPDCPSDMNEPSYAELIFGNSCRFGSMPVQGSPLP